MEDKKTNKILVIGILDRSGSMQANRLGTISGYNEYINQLRTDKETEYQITHIQFDAPRIGAELTVKYEDKPISEVVDLTEKDYEPRGNTPLYDAIGECIRRADQKERGVLVVIITDGLENASTEFNRESIRALIGEKEAAGWKFAFLGCDIDSYSVGASIGISAQSTSNYMRGMEPEMYRNVAHSTISFASCARSVGVEAAAKMDFFDDVQRGSQGDHTVVTPSNTTGGRPAAPPPFPRQPRPTSHRNWTVSK